MYMPSSVILRMTLHILIAFACIFRYLVFLCILILVFRHVQLTVVVPCFRDLYDFYDFLLRFLLLLESFFL